jgi:hypothetical protein
MDQSNLDFLGKLFVAENETFLVDSILAILINYVVRNFKHYRTLLKGVMKAISANCCYQWEQHQVDALPHAPFPARRRQLGDQAWEWY